VHTEVKSIAWRSPAVIGAIGIAVIAVIVAVALGFNNIPFLNGSTRYSAYFSEASGLITGGDVQVAGLKVGTVSSITLDSGKVLITFDVSDDVHLGDRSEAAIRTKALLGTKVLDITTRGDRPLPGPIPLERTRPAYQLTDVLGDLSATVSGVKTDQLNRALTTVARTFAETPDNVKIAVDGVARISQTLDERDKQLRDLLSDANKATAVLADRSDKIVGLVRDTNALLTALQTQRSALDHISANASSLARQLSGFVDDNRAQLRPALDKLNGALTIIDNRKAELQSLIKKLNGYVMSLGEAVSSAPFFKAYIANLVPGQFIQPFVDAAFSDLGLDPHTLSPSQRIDPPIGQPGTPPLPVPYPRTGQGGGPRLNLPDAITGKPGDQQCGPSGIALPGPGCYPYREPPSPGAPGGPPPGPPAAAPPNMANTPEPTPKPVYVQAPGEAPPGPPSAPARSGGGQ
jgi:phospholipid/cholesterol/gamma-HCH transport system substrate-binding protein